MANGIYWCPRCQQQITIQPHSGDAVHPCNGTNATLNNEDILITGAVASDDQGSVDTGRLQGDIRYQGLANKIGGTRAAIENGARVHVLTTRGNPTELFRTRQHFETLDPED